VGCLPDSEALTDEGGQAMLIAMTLAAVYCAAPGRCPTEAQLIAAVSRRDDAETEGIAEEMREGNPDSVVSIRSERIVRITHIRCAQECSDEPGWINCSYRVRYPSRIVLEIAQMSREGPDWILQLWMRSTLEQR
jgi:hypothetical protein